MSGHEGNGNQSLLTVREVSERLRVSVNCVYALVGRGKLACYRVGAGRGAIRIRGEDVEAYLGICRKEAVEVIVKAPRARLKHLTL